MGASCPKAAHPSQSENAADAVRNGGSQPDGRNLFTTRFTRLGTPRSIRGSQELDGELNAGEARWRNGRWIRSFSSRVWIFARPPDPARRSVTRRSDSLLLAHERRRHLAHRSFRRLSRINPGLVWLSRLPGIKSTARGPVSPVMIPTRWARARDRRWWCVSGTNPGLSPLPLITSSWWWLDCWWPWACISLIRSRTFTGAECRLGCLELTAGRS